MASEILRTDGVYPGATARRSWFQWTGEKRPPLKGEYYLSGSIITAYKCEGDGMTYPYHIAREVKRPVCPHCGKPA